MRILSAALTPVELRRVAERGLQVTYGRSGPIVIGGAHIRQPATAMPEPDAALQRALLTGDEAAAALRRAAHVQRLEAVARVPERLIGLIGIALLVVTICSAIA